MDLCAEINSKFYLKINIQDFWEYLEYMFATPPMAIKICLDLKLRKAKEKPSVKLKTLN